LSCSSSVSRRLASTVAVIEFPTIMPAIGTRVRLVSGKTCRPNSTPSVTTAAAVKEASARVSRCGTSGARRRATIEA
jgi:hypothetical protein